MLPSKECYLFLYCYMERITLHTASTLVLGLTQVTAACHHIHDKTIAQVITPSYHIDRGVSVLFCYENNHKSRKESQSIAFKMTDST